MPLFCSWRKKASGFGEPLFGGFTVTEIDGLFGATVRLPRCLMVMNPMLFLGICADWGVVGVALGDVAVGGVGDVAFGDVAVGGVGDVASGGVALGDVGDVALGTLGTLRFFFGCLASEGTLGFDLVLGGVGDFFFGEGELLLLLLLFSLLLFSVLFLILSKSTF